VDRQVTSRRMRSKVQFRLTHVLTHLEVVVRRLDKRRIAQSLCMERDSVMQWQAVVIIKRENSLEDL